MKFVASIILLYIASCCYGESHLRQRRESCNIKYIIKDIFYKEGNIYGENKTVEAATTADCVKACLEHSECRFINYIQNKKACYLLSDGITDRRSVDITKTEHNENSIHVHLDCAVASEIARPRRVRSKPHHDSSHTVAPTTTHSTTHPTTPTTPIPPIPEIHQHRHEIRTHRNTSIKISKVIKVEQKVVTRLIAKLKVTPRVPITAVTVAPETEKPTPMQCGLQAAGFEPRLRKQNDNINLEVVPHSWPWMTYFSVEDSFDVYRCGAALIRVSDKVEASDIVVTAAHCVTYTDNSSATVMYSTEKMQVVAGGHSVRTRAQFQERRKVEDVWFPLNFTIPSRDYDIAVLRLASPIEFNDGIRPICLPEPDEAIPIHQQCVFTGWDRANGGKELGTSILHQVPIKALNTTICEPELDGESDPDLICAGGLDSSENDCQGDAGGILACRLENDAPWTLYGFTKDDAIDFGCISRDQAIASFTGISGFANTILEVALEMTSVKD